MIRVLVFIVVIGLSFSLPASADPAADFIAAHPYVTSIDLATLRLTFVAAATTQQITQANSDAATFNFALPAQPSTVDSLMESIRLDAGISVAGRLELARMAPFLLENYARNPGAASLVELKARWAQLKAADAVITTSDATRAQLDFAAANFPSQ